MKESSFRLWLIKIWTENRDEHQDYNEPVLSQKEYFNRYKYWLKREFKHQQRSSK